MTTTASYKVDAPVMMQLGEFQFGITTAAYQEFSRETEYRWPGQDRFGQLAALQFTGPGSDTVTLPGVVYPEWRGGSGQIDDLRALAAQGVPLLMTAGTGKLMGHWVIERIQEKQSTFAAYGMARKMEFTLALRKYS